MLCVVEGPAFFASVICQVLLLITMGWLVQETNGLVTHVHTTPHLKVDFVILNQMLPVTKGRDCNFTVEGHVAIFCHI